MGCDSTLSRGRLIRRSSERVLAAVLLSMPAFVQAQRATAPPPAPMSPAAHADASSVHQAARHSGPSQGGWHYMVRSGDTLDRIIAQTQAASPFSLAFLRDAFAKINPVALPRGPQGPLIAGTLLRVPDSAELRRIAFPEHEPRPVSPAQVSADPAHSTSLTAAQRDEIERRSWVRYP
jgi:Tfp pilus assembly protein FimV